MECQVCGFSSDGGEKCPACGSESQVEIRETISDEIRAVHNSENVDRDERFEEGTKETQYISESTTIITIPFGIDQAPLTNDAALIPFGIDHAPKTV